MIYVLLLAEIEMRLKFACGLEYFAGVSHRTLTNIIIQSTPRHSHDDVSLAYQRRSEIS